MEVLFSVENYEESDGKFREINSPRTLEACLRSGLDPTELYPRPKSYFASKNLRSEMIDIKYNMFERKRQDKIAIVRKERDSLVQFAEKTFAQTGNASGTGFTTSQPSPEEQKKDADKASALLEIEEKRMEALRRRQEKELSKIVEREQVMADLLNKIKKAEEEEIKKKKIHEKKVAEQKVIEAKKRAQREQEKKQIEAEEVQRKKELLKREAEVNDKIAKSRLENERKLEREARLRDEERKKKVEEARKKTEALIKQQEEMAEQNRIKMMEREAKIIQQLEEKKEKKRLEVQMQREKATKRINEAIEKHHEIFVQKKVAFDTAQSEAAKRAKENEIAERERLRKQADDRERRAKQRMGRLVDAYNNRKQHRQSIVERRQEKEEVYGTIRSQREEKIAMMKFTSDLKLRDKLENVERVARINEFHRLQTLQKIHEQDMRYEKIQQQKEEMLKNHREESKQALQRKHEISDVMEKMRLTNDFTLMDKLFTTKKKKRASTRGGDDGEGEDPRLNQTI